MSRLQNTAKLGECGEILQLTEAIIVACETQHEADGAIIMASEERMQSATSTSRLQRTAKLGMCGEMLQLTEAPIGACEDQQEAAGAITKASEVRRHAECEIYESIATYRKARRVRRDATTDRGHHCGMRSAA